MFCNTYYIYIYKMYFPIVRTYCTFGVGLWGLQTKPVVGQLESVWWSLPDQSKVRNLLYMNQYHLFSAFGKIRNAGIPPEQKTKLNK